MRRNTLIEAKDETMMVETVNFGIMMPNGIGIASVIYFLIILSAKQISGYIKKIFCAIADS